MYNKYMLINIKDKKKYTEHVYNERLSLKKKSSPFSMPFMRQEDLSSEVRQAEKIKYATIESTKLNVHRQTEKQQFLGVGDGNAEVRDAQ